MTRDKEKEIAEKAYDLLMQLDKSFIITICDDEDESSFLATSSIMHLKRDDGMDIVAMIGGVAERCEVEQALIAAIIHNQGSKEIRKELEKIINNS